MDGFQYYNIFETKGLEYLITIAFFVLLVPMWVILNKRAAIKKHLQQAFGVLNPQKIQLPKGVFHSPFHTWAYLKKSGSALIGANELLLRITGPVSLELQANEGSYIQKGALVAELIQNNNKLQLFAPVSGIIKKQNHDVAEDADLINSDPYGKGWLFEIEPDKWREDTKNYYLAEETTQWSENEITKLKDFLALHPYFTSNGSMMAAMQDGGELRENLLSELPVNVWNDFQQRFLQPEPQQ